MRQRESGFLGKWEDRRSLEWHRVTFVVMLSLSISGAPLIEYARGGPARAFQAGAASSAGQGGPYVIHRVAEEITIDGSLKEEAWLRAARSPRFVDMVSGKPGFFDTRAAALWDDEALYIAFWIEEPFVEAAVVDRDDTVFRENDVEVFIDGGDCYYEFEINAQNTIYEVFFIWKDAYDRFKIPEFDVLSNDTYTFGGNHDRGLNSFWRGTHPRGVRWAFTGWDFPGLETAVEIQGTLNDASDVDEGWTVEIAFPWRGMVPLAGNRDLPPLEGSEWRIFFGRFQKLNVGTSVVSPAWSWDPIGDRDNHIPERFTRVIFSKRPAH